jgi:hypothetical protein
VGIVVVEEETGKDVVVVDVANGGGDGGDGGDGVDTGVGTAAIETETGTAGCILMTSSLTGGGRRDGFVVVEGPCSCFC